MREKVGDREFGKKISVAQHSIDKISEQKRKMIDKCPTFNGILVLEIDYIRLQKIFEEIKSLFDFNSCLI